MSKTVLMALCALVIGVAPAMAGVSVSSPVNGATVTSPVQFVATGTSNYVVTAVQVYADNALVYTASGANLNAAVSLSNGAHYIVVKAWDSSGASSMQSLTINVVSGTSTTGGVSITSPQNGATVSSPVQVSATGTAPGGAIAMQIYADGTLVTSASGSTISAPVTLSNGSHNLAVKVWGANSWSTYSTVSVNVQATSSPISTPPAGSTTVSNIQQQPNWSSCGACAGGVSTVPYSMTENIANPSLTGASAQFWLGGTTPYSNAIWWKELTPATASNFSYDVYFYLQNSAAPQALEFDVNQVINGNRFIFGTECDIRYTAQWRVWDTANAHWTSSGVPCLTPSANTWHHLTWEFQRTSSGQALFVAVTLDGVRTPVNMAFWPKANSGSELNVAFQMDGNYIQENYSVWLDKVGLTYW